jgi:hypothetical protein
LPYDSIKDELHNKFQIYKIVRPDLLCQLDENSHICDSNKRAVGPIFIDTREFLLPSKPVFYFTNREPLDIEEFEFHKSKQSTVADESYIYMLYMENDIEIDLLDEYLVKTQDQSLNKQA